MGMSASQARFLSLTARKTNTEYEGQQINQQRTALSNESSNYYSQLTSMAVPVPPSSADYSKVTYTFKDGTENNTITSLVATKDTRTTGVYMLNYVQTIPADTMIVNGTALVSRTGESPNFLYQIGKVTLQKALGSETSADTAPTEPSSLSETDRKKWVDRFTAAGIPYEIASSYSAEEIVAKLAVEKQYCAMAREKYGDDNWYVRYQKNSSSGSYEPVLVGAKELQHVDYNEKTTLSLSGVKQYVFGQTEESREVKNAKAKVEQDASGRYISLFIYDDYEKDPTLGTKYDLTTTTEADEAGYNDAMNQYYYDKAQYDQKVQEVNAKIEVIQVQDKNLELKLKQLDTEQNAIATEMDAVKKVISKNVESSFKTFNG